MTTMKDAIKVSSLFTGSSVGNAGSGKPAHWKDAKGTTFQNPWPSYRPWSRWEAAKFIWSTRGTFPTIPSDVDSQIPSVRPTWGFTDARVSERTEKIKATWLGHACFLIELPARASSLTSVPNRGARILFDPVFSNRCSPSQWFGPERFTKPPCDITDIPEVDAIVISHNHYDHLDTNTIKALSKRLHSPHVFAPLGNANLLRSIGIPTDKIHCLDWWEGLHVEVDVRGPEATDINGGNGKRNAFAKMGFDIICTPCQHFASRSLFDQYKALWASWVLREVLPESSSASDILLSQASNTKTRREEGVKVYFAGDTGYRYVPEGANEDEVPCCSAFMEIGERFGEFDFAMIPIGAYKPRHFMSPVHCAPQDSVRIFQDVRAKKALGMHWGTWMLTYEEVTEPPRKLAEECEKAGIAKEDFGVCKLGETLFF